KDTKTFTYLDNTYSKLMSRSEESQWAENTLITKEQLASALRSKFPSDEFNLQMFPYTYKWKDKSTLLLEVKGKNSAYLVLFDADKKEIKNAIAISTDAAQQALSPNGTH